MKSLRLVILSVALFCSAGAVLANPIPGPKGGRILNTAAPYIEFFVEKNHTATVTFYDADLKPLAPTEQVVTIVTEAWGKKTLRFTKTASGFSSQGTLPKGDDFKITVQIKATAGAVPQNFGFFYEDEKCSQCHREQYACICEKK